MVKVEREVQKLLFFIVEICGKIHISTLVDLIPILLKGRPKNDIKKFKISKFTLQ